MAIWMATGRIELSGVDFFIEADTLEEAKEKAKRGEYEFYEDNGAEAINWTIKPSTVESNE